MSMSSEGKQTSSPSASIKKKTSTDNKRSPKKQQNTGGLRRLPVVKPANELIAKARKFVWAVKPDTYVLILRLECMI